MKFPPGPKRRMLLLPSPLTSTLPLASNRMPRVRESPPLLVAMKALVVPLAGS